MNHRDAEIADVVVILKQTYCERVQHAASMLTAAGLKIISVDEDEAVIEGSVETDKLARIQTLECVNALRIVLTYTADYSTGDPRDKDVDEEDAA
jgi:hypothetical protein